MPIDEHRLEKMVDRGWDLSIPPMCPACGYNLTGLPEPRCPECGNRYTWKYLRQQALDKHAELQRKQESGSDVRTGFVFAGAGLALWGLVRLVGLSVFTRVLTNLLVFLLGLFCFLLGARVLFSIRVKTPETMDDGPQVNPWLGLAALLAGLAVCALPMIW